MADKKRVGRPAKQERGNKIQTWISTDLETKLKQHAELEDMSVSAVVKLAIEQYLGLQDAG